MSVVMLMRWPDVSLEQYDAVRAIVNWEGDVPAGALMHFATHDGKALRVTDLWDTPEYFQAFVDNRLMPGVQQAGIQGAPEVEIYPVHAVFAPGFVAK